VRDVRLEAARELAEIDERSARRARYAVFFIRGPTRASVEGRSAWRRGQGTWPRSMKRFRRRRPASFF